MENKIIRYSVNQLLTEFILVQSAINCCLFIVIMLKSVLMLTLLENYI